MCNPRYGSAVISGRSPPGMQRHFLVILGVMPQDSLQKFEDAVTEGDGFIDWQSIDKSWETYEDALRSVVDRIFYGSNAPDDQLRMFYDKIDEINQVDWNSGWIEKHKTTGLCNTAVNPLLMRCSYYSFAQSYRNDNYHWNRIDSASH